MPRWSREGERADTLARVTTPETVQASVRQKIAMSGPPIGTSARLGRMARAGGEHRADRDADREDQQAQRHDVLGAADDGLTRLGSSDSATAPASQNQETISVPSQTACPT